MTDIKIYNVTVLMTNCCLITDTATGKAAVTDPGAENERLNAEIEKNGGKLEYVLLTHGHYDHITFAKRLADKYSAKIVTGVKNNAFLSDPSLNLTEKHRIPLKPFSADILLSDGDEFMLGETKIKYISTPGHTSGCGAFVFDDTIISGDTLFCESYGRTDLPTGSDEQMASSLKKLKNLYGDYRVIPGHGPETTLSHERKYNPLMRLL